MDLSRKEGFEGKTPVSSRAEQLLKLQMAVWSSRSTFLALKAISDHEALCLSPDQDVKSAAKTLADRAKLTAARTNPKPNTIEIPVEFLGLTLPFLKQTVEKPEAKPKVKPKPYPDDYLHSLLSKAYYACMNDSNLSFRDDYLEIYDIKCELVRISLEIHKKDQTQRTFLPKDLVKLSKLATVYAESLKNGNSFN